MKMSDFPFMFHVLDWQATAMGLYALWYQDWSSLGIAVLQILLVTSMAMYSNLMNDDDD